MFVVYQIYNSDGTFHLSSGSDLFAPGYSSRGGGNGFWTATPDGYHAKSVELLYHNQNESLDVSGGATVMVTGLRDQAIGRFYVDQIMAMRKGTDGKVTLCSGNAASNETDMCPPAAVTKLYRVNFDGTVTLPMATPARARCKRLEDVFPTM
jgi:hypothetical protein